MVTTPTPPTSPGQVVLWMSTGKRQGNTLVCFEKDKEEERRGMKKKEERRKKK